MLAAIPLNKAFFSGMLGATVGAVIASAILLNPMVRSNAISHEDDAVNEINGNHHPAFPAESLKREDVASQLETLRELLNGLHIPGRISPAVQAHLQDMLVVSIHTDPISTAELIDDLRIGQKRFVERLFLELWVESQGTELLSILPATWRETRPLLFGSVFRILANSDPKATLPHILALSPLDHRASLMVNIVYALDAEDVQLVFDTLDKFSGSERQKFLKNDAFELAKKAPHQLLAWSSTLDDGERQLAVTEALTALARQDPKTAIALLDVHPTGNRRGVIQQALRQLAASEPQLAVAEAEKRGRYFSQVAEVWALSDPASASQWLIQRTPKDRNSSHDPLMNIASKWGRRDLDRALAFSETLPEALRGRWIGSVAANLAITDLDRYESLAQAYIDTPYAAGMHTHLAHKRYYEDPEQGIREVLNLKPELRDKPLASLIDHSMTRNPETAAPLLEKITDQDTRMQTLSRVLRRWQDAEDGAMERWLENEASPMLRDEGYAALAANQPALLTAISDEKLRVAAYLRNTERSRSTIALKRLLEKVGLSEAQWDTLNEEAIAAAK